MVILYVPQLKEPVSYDDPVCMPPKRACYARLILYACQVVMEARDKAVEAVKLRWAEERWQEHECGSR